MTSSSRTDALIRDIAKLFVTYPASVWRPVLNDLRSGGDSQQEVARAIEKLLSATASAKSKTKSARGGGGRAKPLHQLDLSVARSVMLTSVRTGLNKRDLLPSAADLRGFYLSVGGKGELPSNRSAAVIELLRHLDGLADAAFGEALSKIADVGGGKDGAGEYGRWFELIRPGRRAE